jgi:hypothetical protein
MLLAFSNSSFSYFSISALAFSASFIFLLAASSSGKGQNFFVLLLFLES